MAGSQRKDTSTKQQPPKKWRRWLPKVLLGLFLVIILAAGFIFGVFLKYQDNPMLSQERLRQMPVLGQLLPPAVSPSQPLPATVPANGSQPVVPSPVPPATGFPPGPPVAGTLPSNQAAAAGQATPVVPGGTMSQASPLQQMQAAQARQVGKLARLYNDMKPEEVVPILQQMDDATVLKILSKMDEDQVARILALMDTSRAARLSRLLLQTPNP